MKILLTGARGAIGRELLPILLQSGHTVLSF
ncbi:MAG: NAD(P)-dependent oxidoreductase, partial [Spirochaetia bacterium]|nr:NAD(P)-dependent oxidoreductase [Spirochaetia bacterium]